MEVIFLLSLSCGATKYLESFKPTTCFRCIQNVAIRKFHIESFVCLDTKRVTQRYSNVIN